MMVSSRLADQVGRVLGGRYRLLAPIGTGASARVFLAEDVTLRRRVAVKLLHAALADDESFLRRFRAEAQSAGALSHPHVMAVYDWGEGDDGPYLVLEYLDGGSLRAMLDRGRLLSPSQALLVALQTAQGLAYAHRRGLVHRDVKPANLLFDDEGRLRIADFGIARALAEAAWTEPTGAVMGSARYASPEQAQGGSLDGRSDVYSLALVMVEAVTGRVPFAADTTIATLMGRIGAPLEAPAELGPLVPVVERAGRPDPDERLDAAELVIALDEAARQLPSPAALPLAGAVADDEVVVVHRDPTVHHAPAPSAAQGPAPASPPPPTVPAAVRRRRARWPWVALLTVVLLVAGAAGGYAVRQASRPSHPVPDLTGRSVAAARAAVRDDHLRVVVASSRYDEVQGEGAILEQHPSRGKLKEGATIEVITSKGPAPREVPDLSGLDQAAARKRLEDSGFTVHPVSRPDEQAKPGQVLTWSPRGTQPKRTTIEIVVSSGPAPRMVPAGLEGKTLAEAAAVLQGVQLVPVERAVFSDTVEAGRVVTMNPPPGSSLARGARVTVDVSKGPQPVPVPRLSGLTVTQARSALQKAGLRVGGVYGPPGGRRVINTRPIRGTVLRRGSAVDLYIA